MKLKRTNLCNTTCQQVKHGYNKLLYTAPQCGELINTQTETTKPHAY